MPKNITSVEWSATGVPSGVSFNTQTGTFSGTPEAEGTYTVPVHVETNYGEDTKDVVIEIESAYPVYAIGARAHTWSEGAEADSYGFRKLNMPKATRLFDLYGGFAATTPDGMYVCGIEAKDVGLEGTDFGNPTTPKRLPIDDVEEMYGGLCYSAGAAYKSTAYKLSNGNAYAVGQGNSTGRYSITDGSVLSVPRVLSYNQYIAATAKGRQGIITGVSIPKPKGGGFQ